jgi:hypothetical protein
MSILRENYIPTEFIIDVLSDLHNSGTNWTEQYNVLGEFANECYERGNNAALYSTASENMKLHARIAELEKSDRQMLRELVEAHEANKLLQQRYDVTVQAAQNSHARADEAELTWHKLWYAIERIPDLVNEHMDNLYADKEAEEDENPNSHSWEQAYQYRRGTLLTGSRSCGISELPRKALEMFDDHD